MLVAITQKFLLNYGSRSRQQWVASILTDTENVSLC